MIDPTRRNAHLVVAIEAAGLRRGEAARLAGLSPQHLSRIISRQSMPRPATAQALARTLNTPIEMLDLYPQGGVE